MADISMKQWLLGMLLIMCFYGWLALGTYEVLSSAVSWKIAKHKNTIEAYQSYLEKYPDRRDDEARSILAGSYFQKAKDINTIEAYEDFLTRYPNSKYMFDVQRFINELNSKK